MNKKNETAGTQIEPTTNETSLAIPETNGMMVTDDGMVGKLLSRSESYCSIPASTRAEKAAIFNAMANPDERLAKMINKSIDVVDIYAEMVQMKSEKLNKETGELVEKTDSVPRVVLIDDNGKSYACASTGIFNAVKRLIQTFGEPTWTPPLRVEIQQIDRGVDKKILSLKVVG